MPPGAPFFLTFAAVKVTYKNIATILLSVSILLLDSCRKPANPPGPDNSTVYSACFAGGSSATLDIVTFNTELFPLKGYETVAELAVLIRAINADIIAFQEISSFADFDRLDNLLTNYSGIKYPIENSDWSLAYLYNTSEISIDNSETRIIFDDDFWAFPRPPFEIHATHLPTSQDLILLNNHLKCCGGYDNESRRRSASDQLHAYVMDTYPDKAVIILGDLNDEIGGTSENSNVFWSFVNDPVNFRVADMEIAKGSELWWSYPSYPSHIDHIIVSDELFAKIDTTMVLKPDACYSNYPDVISDHRPVYLRLK